jgi:hypothetical protein
MPQVLMNFQHNQRWWVHFVESDWKTSIGQRTRYLRFETLDDLRAFVTRCYPDGASLEEFENNVRMWARGSLYVNLTDDQYAKLK